MTEAWSCQISPKLADGSLINVRGTDPAEVIAQLEELAQGGERILEAMAQIKQAAMAKGVSSTPVAAPAARPTQHAPAASNGALACMHGPYVDKKGKTKANGEPYQYRYFCKKYGPEGCKASSLVGQEPGGA